jgi:hypothetical protein
MLEFFLNFYPYLPSYHSLEVFHNVFIGWIHWLFFECLRIGKVLSCFLDQSNKQKCYVYPIKAAFELQLRFTWQAHIHQLENLEASIFWSFYIERIQKVCPWSTSAKVKDFLSFSTYYQEIN